MTQHPQRCETCMVAGCNERTNTTVDFISEIRKQNIIQEFIEKHGCASHSSASGPVPEPGGAPNVSCDNDPCQFCFDGGCSFKCRKWDALVQTAATKARAEVLDAFTCFIDGYSRCVEDGLDYVSVIAIQNLIESLRQQEGKP